MKILSLVLVASAAVSLASGDSEQSGQGGIRRAPHSGYDGVTRYPDAAPRSNMMRNPFERADSLESEPTEIEVRL